MKDAHWLDPGIDTIRDQTQGQALLELGCGRGADTGVLVSRGFNVVALDLNAEALNDCLVNPGCTPVRADVSATLPFADNSFRFLLASLSLHYFNWEETLAIASEIQRVLASGGMLLMRVNSTEDVNFGAGSGEALESDYFRRVNGQEKRFFKAAHVRAMLQNLTLLDIAHETIDRYGKDKNVWVAHAMA